MVTQNCCMCTCKLCMYYLPELTTALFFVDSCTVLCVPTVLPETTQVITQLLKIYEI